MIDRLQHILHILIALALGIAIGWGIGTVRTKQQVVREQAVTVVEKAQEGAKSARQARESRGARATYRGKEKTQQEAAIDEAAKNNPGWSDAAVPDGVWDSLGGK